MFFASKVPVKARHAYKKDAVAGMLVAVMMGLSSPFIAVIARKTLGASEFEIAAITMGPTAVNCLSLFWANMMEGRPKMPFATWPTIIARALLIPMGFVAAPLPFVLLWIVSSFFGSIAGTAYAALMQEIYPDGDRARVMGYVRFCMFSVYLVITAVAGPLLKVVSHKYVFPVAAVFGIASAYMFNRIPVSEPRAGGGMRPDRFLMQSLRIVIDDHPYRWFCGAILVFGFGNLMAQPIFVLYQTDVLNIDTRWAGGYAIACSLVMMISYLYWGSYIDARNPVKLTAIQILVWSFIPLNYLVAHQPWALLPGTLVAGLMASGMELSGLNALLRFSPREKITHYQALGAWLMGVRGIAAPLLGTWLLKSGVLSGSPITSMRWLFVISWLIMMASVGIMWIGLRKYPQPQNECG